MATPKPGAPTATPHTFATTPFFVASKQPEARAPKEPPKRVRAAPAAKPVPAPPSAADRLVDAFFRGGGALAAPEEAFAAPVTGPTRVHGGSPPLPRAGPLAGSKRRGASPAGERPLRKQAQPRRLLAAACAEAASASGASEEDEEGSTPEAGSGGAGSPPAPHAEAAAVAAAVVHLNGFEVRPALLPPLLLRPPASPALWAAPAPAAAAWGPGGAPPAPSVSLSPYVTAVALAAGGAGGLTAGDDGFSLTAFLPLTPGGGGLALRRGTSASSLGF